MATTRAMLRPLRRAIAMPRVLCALPARHLSIASIVRPTSYQLSSAESRLSSCVVQRIARTYSDGPGMTLRELEDRCQEILKLFDKVDASKVNLSAKLVDDLGLDSLDVVEVVMAYEDDFGVEISDEDAEKLKTVQDVVDFLQKALHIS